MQMRNEIYVVNFDTDHILLAAVFLFKIKVMIEMSISCWTLDIMSEPTNHFRVTNLYF